MVEATSATVSRAAPSPKKAWAPFVAISLRGPWFGSVNDAWGK